MTTGHEHQHIAVQWVPTELPSRTASGGDLVEQRYDWRPIGRDSVRLVQSTVAAREAKGRTR